MSESVVKRDVEQAPRPVAGIIVGSTWRDRDKHGLPVLGALYQSVRCLRMAPETDTLGDSLDSSRERQKEPFLLLVDPEKAVEYGEEGGKWCTKRQDSSATLAQDVFRRRREAIGDGRLLLVHLGHRNEFMHSGLLPWLTLFGGETPEITPVPLHDMLLELLTGKSRVVVMTSGNYEEASLDRVLQGVWSGLMSKLDHRTR